jgi:hypothetical protein
MEKTLNLFWSAVYDLNLVLTPVTIVRARGEKKWPTTKSDFRLGSKVQGQMNSSNLIG